MTRRLLTASAAAALVLGLAACGDDTGGTITDPPSTIATGASDGGGTSDGGGAGGSTGGASDDGGNTEAAPDIPAPDPADYPGMDEETDEGAEQAFKYYFDTAFWGFQTGDATSLKNMTSESCNSCQEMIGDIEELRNHGDFWSQTDIKQVRLESAKQDDQTIEVTYGFTVSEHTEPDLENGGSRSKEPLTAYAAVGGTRWVDDHWIIDGMALSGEHV
ncbi:DUF6318 family protein [Brachybacterium squillarum]|uniref:DUF6318 family protein n=1 Tax=Brachybacterium squillarum TaxID=661979 RepID=UPI0022232A08|nr:DUF6318 family protein [Brachybacterium squillarum]MCW1804372.1 DUF6318 family protein [Brachybacterium squillarum]